MKCIFIYNPKSGKGKIFKNLDYIKSTLEKKYDVVDIHESTSSGDVKNIALEACGKYDVIIFSGGDGTFNEVTCGVAASENRPILGYIPTGTANDIARNLKIPRNIKKALKIITDGVTIKHDVGKVNDSYFMYVLGAGTCTSTSYTTKHHAKKLLGRLAYVKNGLDEIFNTPTFNISFTSDNKNLTTTTPLILVMNSKSVGGISFNKYGHLNDGYFDIIIVKNDFTYGRWNIFMAFLAGLLRIRWKKTAIALRQQKFSLDVSDDVIWCVDGEKGPTGKVVVENLKGRLEIFAPNSKIKKR